MQDHTGKTKSPILSKKSIRFIKKWSLTVFASTLLVSSLFVINTFAQSEAKSPLILDMTNQERTSRGLTPLTLNNELEKAAYNKAQDMFTYQYFEHVSPQGKTPWQFITNAGYDYFYAGENLAIDFDNINSTEKAWMNSPSHRANILDPHYREMGVASVTNQFHGKTTTITVEMFGTSSLDSALDSLKNLW